MSAVSSMQLHVLIVDDAPTDRIAFRRYLTKGTEHPCVVTEVSTGGQALAQLNESIPHCVLLDFDLPDCDGLSLVRNLVEAHGAHADVGHECGAGGGGDAVRGA